MVPSDRVAHGRSIAPEERAFLDVPGARVLCEVSADRAGGSVLRLLRALESRLGAAHLHSDEALLYPSGAFERLFVR